MRIIEDHTDSMLCSFNNNPVEHFNSLICKKIGGKRVNYCLRGSHQARCNAAAVSYSNPSPVAAIHKVMLARSPGHYTKLREQRKHRQTEKKKLTKTCKKGIVQFRCKVVWCTVSKARYYGASSKAKKTTNS